MLGRKVLYGTNPLYGKNLDKRPIRMDAEQRYMKEHWYIEELTIDDTLPPGYLINEGWIRPRALNAGLNFDLNWEPERFNKTAPELSTKYYVLPKASSSMQYEIVTGDYPLSSEILPIVGPVDDYNVCVDLLYLYCHVNNFTIDVEITSGYTPAFINKFKIKEKQ